MNLKIKKGKQTITTSIAYIAGFLDGEGCIRIKRANQGGNLYYLWVAITNSHKPTLDFVQGIFGGQIRKAEKAVNKTIYHYLITASEASDMLKTVVGFLRDKKKQAELAIIFHENKERLSPSGKDLAYRRMRDLKKSNLYENPELLNH
jgi:hypothetical protein